MARFLQRLVRRRFALTGSVRARVLPKRLFRPGATVEGLEPRTLLSLGVQDHALPLIKPIIHEGLTEGLGDHSGSRM